MDRGQKKRKPRKRFEGNCFNCGRKGPRAEDCKSKEKEIKQSRDAPAHKKGGGRGKFYVCGREEHFAYKHCGLCRSLLHGTRDCKERGAEKGAMLAKINVSGNNEMALVVVTRGAARGDGKEEWDSDFGASFHTSHIQARTTAYTNTPAGTIVEVADGAILPEDSFWTVEVDLDQPGTTTKPVKMDSVAYVPERLRNLLSFRKAVE